MLVKFIKILFVSKILSLKGIPLFIKSVYQSGFNICTLIYFSSFYSPNKIAIVFKNKKLTYNQLKEEIELCSNYYKSLNIQKKTRIALFCNNSPEFLIHLASFSSLGCEIYLLNTDLSEPQIQTFQNKFNFDYLISDDEYIDSFFSNFKYVKIISTNKYKNIDNEKIKIKKNIRSMGGKLILLTGGTSGKIKTAERKISSISFIYPLYALIQDIKLHKYKSVLISIPAFHGYGLVSIIVSIFLQKEIYLMQKHDINKVLNLIQINKIEVIILVPIQLQRLMKSEIQELNSLKVIITGGSNIQSDLVIKTLQQFGKIVFNLYGTTESGFCILATPNDLIKNPSTIGKPIKGVTVVLKNIFSNKIIKSNYAIGKIYLKNSWSISTKNNLINTGDIGFFDEDNYFYLKGRSDEIVISGGENIYPKDVEEVLLDHPLIKEAAIIGIKDEDYGQVLKVFIVLKNNEKITEAEIKQWLKTKVAKFQIPKKVEFVNELPYTTIGKLKKSMLN